MTNLATALLARRDDSIAIEEPGGRTLSYRQLDDLAGQYANALVGFGVKVGDRVAVQVEKSVSAVALYLGALKAGAIFLPLNTAYTPHEIRYFLGDAEPALVVLDPGVADGYGDDKVATLDADGAGSMADAAAAAPTQFATVTRAPDDLAVILYTSGTTGRSKGAMITHRNLLSNAGTLRDHWRFTAADVLLHALPIYHAHGLFVGLNMPLLAGAKLLFRSKFDAVDVLHHLPAATTMMGVPTFYTRLLQTEALDRETTAGIRLFVSGSAPLLADTHREWSERTGHAILERYGMTETGMNTSNPYDGARVPGSVGPPLPGIEARITEPGTDRELPRGDIGMIEVRGPNVFSGYWRMPEKTAEELRADGWFITGDLGYLDDAGYVWIVGRGKDLVISGGFNVYPREVEEVIDAVPGVVESAVVGVPHPDFGEAVTAVVVVTKDDPADEARILDALRDQLAKFKMPKRVHVVAELPRNTMGKVQKSELRRRYKDDHKEGAA